MMMTRFGRAIRIGLLSGLLVPGGAMVAAAAPAQSAQAPSNTEQAYLRNAMDINLIEVALGRLALERGSSDEVKQMATKMVERHTALQSKLGDIARQWGVSPSSETPSERRATQDHLKSLSGGKFDAAFKQAVEDIHQQEMALHRNELAGGTDSALREYAQTRVTALEQSAAQAKGAPKKPKRDW